MTTRREANILARSDRDDAGALWDSIKIMQRHPFWVLLSSLKDQKMPRKQQGLYTAKECVRLLRHAMYLSHMPSELHIVKSHPIF